MSGVFILKDKDEMERVQTEKLVVVKNVNSNGILLQNAKRISLKTEGIKATEYFLEVQEQDENVDIQQAQFVAIENECEEGEGTESQFVPLEMDEEGQIILPDNDVILWDELCRICANTSDKVVPIFSGEGLEHNLSYKIQSYLPLTVTENDTLPLQVCYNCAATLLAWHEMTENCVDAQQRLIELQNKMDSKTQVQNNVSEEAEEEELEEVAEEEEEEEEMELVDNGTEIDNSSNQEEQVPVEGDEKNETEAEQTIDDPETDRAWKREKPKPGEFNYMCGLCEQLYPTEIDLMKHMRCKHRDETNHTAGLRYECNVCNRSYCSKSRLIAHLRLHDRRLGRKKSGYRSEDEAIESAKTFDKRTHKLQFQCHVEDCKALLQSRRGILRHMRVHKDERPIVCEYCGKSYRIEDDLKRHIDDVHRKIKRHQCDICGRYFAAKGTRDAHRRIHTQEKPYPCPECGKHFRSINLLGIHRRIHKDLRPFKCSYCPMAFREKQKRQQHEMAIHTKIKPYECELCDRKFAAKGELNRHRSVHFPEQKPYLCSECGIGFRLTRYLRNHIKRYHAKDAEAMLKSLERP